MKCPVCLGEGVQRHGETIGFGRRISCPRCGKFDLSLALEEELRHAVGDFDGRHRLSSWIRSQDAKRIVARVEGSIEDLTSNLPDPTVSERLGLTLEYLERVTFHPGARCQTTEADLLAFTWSRNFDEVSFLLASLDGAGLVHLFGDPLLRVIHVTAKGYQELEVRGTNAQRNRRVFVAMSFSEELLPAYEEGIRPAIEGAGFLAVRMDQSPHGERIDARILLEIRRCRALVADATLHRPSVYFEAGVAEGMGKPVFWTCRSSWLEQNGLPFDTRQYPHTAWGSPAELKSNLQPILEYRLNVSRAR